MENISDFFIQVIGIPLKITLADSIVLKYTVNKDTWQHAVHIAFIDQYSTSASVAPVCVRFAKACFYDFAGGRPVARGCCRTKPLVALAGCPLHRGAYHGDVFVAMIFWPHTAGGRSWEGLLWEGLLYNFGRFFQLDVNH